MPDWPYGLVTTTSLAPTVLAGAVAVIEVALTQVTPVAAMPPIVTVAPLTKPPPAMVTIVPPATSPLAGEILITVGVGRGGITPVTEVLPFALIGSACSMAQTINVKQAISFNRVPIIYAFV